MNSVRYRIGNPWGLHARPSAFVVTVTTTCAKDWEVIAAVRGTEADAKSILGLMSLVAGYGTEIEFMSLMPAERWAQFTMSLESLFFVIDHRGNKANAYDPVQRVVWVVNDADRPSCSLIQDKLIARAAQYNCGPIFERVDEADYKPSPIRTAAARRVPLEHIDTFISYDSRDFSYAVSVYDALIDRGFNVFLAGASLPQTGNSDFQLAIEDALAKTASMLLLTSDATHLEGGWVRAEWTTFLNEKRAGRKRGNLVIVKPKQIATEDLPLMLRMFQTEDISPYGKIDPAAVDRIVKLLSF